jgi:hypothetical protein
MALLTRVTDASLDASTGMISQQLTGLLAGEDLDVAAPCYIKAADGLVYMCNATAATEPAKCYGFTPRAVKSGQAVTLFGVGARFRYGSGLTPGANYFVGATAGRLDTAATTGDAVGVAYAIDTTDIMVARANGKLS